MNNNIYSFRKRNTINYKESNSELDNEKSKSNSKQYKLFSANTDVEFDIEPNSDGLYFFQQIYTERGFQEFRFDVVNLIDKSTSALMLINVEDGSIIDIEKIKKVLYKIDTNNQFNSIGERFFALRELSRNELIYIKNLIVQNGDLYDGKLVIRTTNITNDFLKVSTEKIFKVHYQNNYTKNIQTITYTNGNKYCGEVLNDIPNGQGKLIWKNGDMHEGEFLNGRPNGHGKISYRDGRVYEGEFSNGVSTYGKMIYNNGEIYEGGFLKEKCHGKGKITYSTGETYESTFIKGKHIGKGKMTFPNGTIYSGEILHGKPNGYGIYIIYNGNKYEGEVLNSKLHGKGKFTLSDGSTFTGTFLNDKFNVGVWADIDGTEYQGDFAGLYD